jgi:tRNA A-37 threonylcarbamoyl transferase component Bud32
VSHEVFGADVLLGGKYRVLRTLGEGGMAIVVEAEHVKLGHRVAIKVLAKELAAHPDVVARFEREGRALSKLRSKNVVRVFDVDVTPGGCPFLVMESLTGSDLDAELQRRGPLPIVEAVGYLLQACTAIAEAHALGIVHRDLKPSNLFLAAEGDARVLKVLDFGIAIDEATSDKRLTTVETIMGTPSYMAPEQFRSTKDVDGRADIWALGATLYDLLTGRPPFSGSPTTIGVSIVTDDVQPLRELRPDAPDGLSEVVGRALTKDREHRFASMKAFADALQPFGTGVVVGPRASYSSVPEVESAETLFLPAATMDVVRAVTAPGAAAPQTTSSPTPRAAVARWWPIALLVPLAATALVVTQGHAVPEVREAASTSARTGARCSFGRRVRSVGPSRPVVAPSRGARRGGRRSRRGCRHRSPDRCARFGGNLAARDRAPSDEPVRHRIARAKDAVGGEQSSAILPTMRRISLAVVVLLLPQSALAQGRASTAAASTKGVVLPVASPPEPTSASRAAKLRDDANSAMLSMRYADALDAYVAALSLTPDDAGLD